MMTDVIFTEKKNKTKANFLLALLILASVTDGITQGILILQEKIAQTAFSATDFDITLIGIISSTTIIISFIFSYFYANKNKKWTLVISFLSCRLIFLFSFFIHHSGTLLLFLFLYNMAFCIQTLVTNNFFLYFFGKESGFYFGIARSVLMFFMMAASLFLGNLLDYNPSICRWALAVIAFTSLITYAILYWIESQIRYTEEPDQTSQTFFKSIVEIIKNTDFIIFETLFMIYGFAFMLCLPTVNLFLLNALKLSNAEMANAKGIYAQLFIMLTIPFAGKIFDKMNIWKTGAVSYVILILYPVFFILSLNYSSKSFAYTGYLFYSLGLSGVSILWNLGTASFSNDRDSLMYQGFHQSLTGIRGFIGPLLGYYLLLKFGYGVNFYLSLFLFIVAAIGSIGYYKFKNASVYVPE